MCGAPRGPSSSSSLTSPQIPGMACRRNSYSRIYRTGEQAMLTDFRKLLDVVAVRAGWKPGEIRSKMFRHTYCAARLQTVDGGAPVSTYTVSREMGHGGEAMVRRVYGHLGQVRHRAEAVEYRVEQHAAKLGARLEALRGVGFGTTIGTTA